MLAAARIASAQTPSPTESGVALVSVGAGTGFFSWLGHTALLVKDAGGNQTLFDYGVVHPGPALIRGLLHSNVTAYPAMWEPPRMLSKWSLAGRSVELQWLSLTEPQQAALLKRLLADQIPEPHGYLYELRTDNCTTRIRDLLDAVTGGALRRVGSSRVDLQACKLEYSIVSPK